MVVFILQKVPVGLRGDLTRWMLEPRTGVFVGKPSAMVRDRLWAMIGERKGVGSAVLIHAADNEQGFVIHTAGEPDRIPRDFEGLTLIQIPS